MFSLSADFAFARYSSEQQVDVFRVEYKAHVIVCCVGGDMLKAMAACLPPAAPPPGGKGSS